jgi:hypothetical protein
MFAAMLSGSVVNLPPIQVFTVLILLLIALYKTANRIRNHYASVPVFFWTAVSPTLSRKLMHLSEDDE